MLRGAAIGGPLPCALAGSAALPLRALVLSGNPRVTGQLPPCFTASNVSICVEAN